MPARCTLELLLFANKGTYQNKKGHMGAERYLARYRDKSLLTHFEDHGYEVVGDRAPAPMQKSNLGGVALAPIDETDKGPLVIAFRGTDLQDSDDVKEDLDLFFTGTVGKPYRDEAYAFYLEMRKKMPDRRIIFTGHSLGGHLAQYVALKALNEENDQNFSVRTFNSAPIDTKHKEGLASSFAKGGHGVSPYSMAVTRFRHYRLLGDPVSVVGERIGRMVTVSSKASAKRAHKLDTVHEDMPRDLLEQTIDDLEFTQQFREKMVSARCDYQSHIDAQGFSKYRSGVLKLVLVQMEIDRIIAIVDDGNPAKKERVMARIAILKSSLKPLSSWFGSSESDSLVLGMERAADLLQSEEELRLSARIMEDAGSREESSSRGSMDDGGAAGGAGRGPV